MGKHNSLLCCEKKLSGGIHNHNQGNVKCWCVCKANNMLWHIKKGSKKGQQRINFIVLVNKLAKGQWSSTQRVMFGHDKTTFQLALTNQMLATKPMPWPPFTVTSWWNNSHPGCIQLKQALMAELKNTRNQKIASLAMWTGRMWWQMSVKASASWLKLFKKDLAMCVQFE